MQLWSIYLTVTHWLPRGVLAAVRHRETIVELMNVMMAFKCQSARTSRRPVFALRKLCLSYLSLARHEHSPHSSYDHPLRCYLWRTVLNTFLCYGGHLRPHVAHGITISSYHLLTTSSVAYIVITYVTVSPQFLSSRN